MVAGTLLTGIGLVVRFSAMDRMFGAGSKLDPKRPETLVLAKEQVSSALNTIRVGEVISGLGGVFGILGMIGLAYGSYLVYRRGDAVRWADAFWPPPN
jgi:hypothetical protein